MIKIVDIKKSLAGKQVLRGVNLEINKGETIVIIGRSGCGKSVLLRHIIGLLKPDSGSIFIDNTDIVNCSQLELKNAQKRFGMLFQSAALFDSLTVEENVGFALFRYSNLPVSEIKEIVKEKLALVGLFNVEKLKPAELSGGMRKRVGLARAIATEPDIIMYDEPTTGLDPIMADAINDLIIDLKKKINATSIAVTHDMTSAYKIGDRIAMLYEGVIVAEGTPGMIKASDNPVVKQFINGEASGPITVHEESRPGVMN